MPAKKISTQYTEKELFQLVGLPW